MDEREQNELLWRSCYLGMRIALQSLNTSDALEKFAECLRFLGEIAAARRHCINRNMI